MLLSETEPLLLSPPPGRSRTRSGVCLFLCSREGSDAVDGLCLYDDGDDGDAPFSVSDGENRDMNSICVIHAAEHPLGL